MSPTERAILTTQTQGEEPRLSLRSHTRVDTGLWWYRTRLWVCVTELDVIVFAAARRHYIKSIPIADCKSSHYCHTTGELVIQSAEDLQISRLRLSPSDALRLLRLLGAVAGTTESPPQIAQQQNLNHSENSRA